jgi:hypothetical protein
LLPFAEAIAHCSEIMGFIFKTTVLGFFWLLVAVTAMGCLIIILDILLYLVVESGECLKRMREGQIRLESEEGADGAMMTSPDV